MQIIFVPGILTFKFSLKGWKRDLKKAFPEDEVIFLDNIFYTHFEHKKCEKIIEQGVKVLNNKRPTIILAHSFGGILAKSMIKRAAGANVKKLVTMASPHKLNYLGVLGCKRFLKVPDFVSVPTKTFGGRFDVVVPMWLSSTESSEHENLNSGHLRFLFSPKIRKQILESILKT